MDRSQAFTDIDLCEEICPIEEEKSHSIEEVNLPRAISKTNLSI